MDIEIKSMTRGQIRDLRKAGLDLALQETEDKTKNLDALEWIFDHVYPDLAKDDSIPYSEVIDVAAKTYAKTYGREIEVKN